MIVCRRCLKFSKSITRLKCVGSCQERANCRGAYAQIPGGPPIVRFNAWFWLRGECGLPLNWPPGCLHHGITERAAYRPGQRSTPRSRLGGQLDRPLFMRESRYLEASAFTAVLVLPAFLAFAQRAFCAAAIFARAARLMVLFALGADLTVVPRGLRGPLRSTVPPSS